MFQKGDPVNETFIKSFDPVKGFILNSKFLKEKDPFSTYFCQESFTKQKSGKVTVVAKKGKSL